MAAQIELSRTAPAPADRVWDLMAEPACWPAWAPHMWHVRGEDGAATTIHEGQRLRIVAPVVDIGLVVEITQVDPPRSWTMRTQVPLLGTVTSMHEVSISREAEGEQTTVTLTMESSAPMRVAAPLLAAYRPLATLAITRMLDLAGREEDGRRFSRLRMCLPDLPGM